MPPRVARGACTDIGVVADVVVRAGQTVGILVPALLLIPDGGVDAKVEASSFADESNIIFPGSTVYQIKTGDSFNPTNPSRIVAELFTERPTRTPAPASPASTSRRRVSQAPAKRPAKPTR